MTLALAGMIAAGAVQSCKKEPFQVLGDTVYEVNQAISDGDKAMSNKLTGVAGLIYDEATNTVKVEVPENGINSNPDIIMHVLTTTQPSLDAAIKDANANVMIVFITPDGQKREVLYENS